MYKVVVRSVHGELPVSDTLELNECIFVIDEYMKEPQPEDKEYRWVRRGRKLATLVHKGKVLERMIIVKVKD